MLSCYTICCFLIRRNDTVKAAYKCLDFGITDKAIDFLTDLVLSGRCLGAQLNTHLSPDSEASNMSAEECRLREENLKLNRQLYWEREQRLKLSRALSESNSSLEMDEERLVLHFIVCCLSLVLNIKIYIKF